MEARKDSDKKVEILDQLCAESDAEYTKQFMKQNEIILMSCKVTKFNKYNWQQERNIIITNQNIYNFKQKKVKRIINIERLAGLTKSLKSQSKEFVIHVKKDYDYRLKSEMREKIFNVIKMAYTSKNKINLPIFGIKNKELREFATTEKDLEKGLSRIPLQLARVYEEDVLDEPNGGQDGKNAKSDEPIEILDDYSKNLERRSRAYSQRGSSQYGKQPVDPKVFEDEYKEEECQTVFQRQYTDGEAKFDDFRLLSQIGKGTFGKHQVAGKLYAMKSIRKDIVIEHDSIENLHLEKLILLQVNHPFIISMEFVFIKSLRIYFIMDFIRGGELFKHLSESKRFTEDRTRFYAAQVALALGYLHKAKIIYRDMKPENILLNQDGYILLADFGLAKINDVEGDEPNSFCGTPEYLSPEMIVGSGHDHTLDWWALGVLIYEMIIGIPPFYNKNKHQMYYLIQHAPIRWPDQERHGISVSEDAKDLITRLLDKDRKKRLGYINDVDEVLGHSFFKDIDLEKLIKKQIAAPFKPTLQSEHDLSNFDSKFMKMDLTESVLPEEGIQKIQAKKDAFEKFGFAYEQWIVVQPKNKNLKGRCLEKVGYWLPRKTKTAGATPTKGVHRLLEKFEMVPKYPPPFGSSSLYYKPEKNYNLEYFKTLNRKDPNKALYVRGMLQEQMNLVERKKRLQFEAQEGLGQNIGASIANLEEAKTTDIESEEADIFDRKNKFEELLKRMERHRKETAHLRGNDLRYNIYMRKLQKMTRMDLGLDIEAYKDYVNNLKQFAHVNQDFELYARDSLKVDEFGHRTLVEVEDSESDQDKLAFKVKSHEVLNTLRKLKREAAGYLHEHDHKILEEFLKDMRTYMVQDFDILNLIKSIYTKRMEEAEARQRGDKQMFDLGKVRDIDMEDGNVTKREFEQMKLLMAVDENIFRPSEFGVFSPHSLIVDISKYGDSLPKDAKEILYRPPKLKLLYEKYWQLANAVDGRVKEENDRKILKEFNPRYPQKSADELQMIEKIMSKLENLIGEDERLIISQLTKIEEMKEASGEIQKGSRMDQLSDRIKGDFYYEGAGTEALKKWRAMTEQEKAVQRKGDEIDDIDTTDLEKMDQPSDEEFQEDQDNNILDHLEDNRINLARAFLGYKGGYSVRKLKKFYKQSQSEDIGDQNRNPAQEDDNASASEFGESQETVQDQDMNVGETQEEAKAKTKDGRVEEYSDESDIDEEFIKNIPDEKFHQLMEEATTQDFGNEEEALNYLIEKFKNESKKRRDPRKPDTLSEKDPYYKMMKNENEDIQAITDSRATGDYMVVDKSSYFQMLDQADKGIGRYPIGYRHFENYENYKIMNPEATLQEYHETMNRQVEYEEFKEMMKKAYLKLQQNPYYNWKRNIELAQPDVDYTNLGPQDFIQTEIFENMAQEEYQQRVKFYLLERSWFKLVDALEEFTDFWYYGRDFYNIPDYNVYTPVRHHIANKPKLGDDRKDDTSYRYDMNRLSPYNYLNPLKGYKMSHPAGPFYKKENMHKNKVGFRNRRLSKPKMFNFSTNNRVGPAEEETQRRMWYLTNFSNTFHGVTQNPLLLGEAQHWFK